MYRSLGCIVYEMLVGTPPFTTNSILQLVHLIRHEAIKWPNFLSTPCIDFLKGLLQKDPTMRLTWPNLLSHPFLKGNVNVATDGSKFLENSMCDLCLRSPTFLKLLPICLYKLLDVYKRQVVVI